MESAALKVDTRLIKAMLTGQCKDCAAKPEDAVDLCGSCEEMSHQFTKTALTCPFESIPIVPPTIYVFLLEDAPVNYHHVVTAMRVLLDAYRIACDPAVFSPWGSTPEYEKSVAGIKNVAIRYVDFETSIVRDTDAEFAKSPDRLTYLRRLEARVCAVRAVMKIAAQGETSEKTFEERIEHESSSLFKFCGSLAVHPLPPAVSWFQQASRGKLLGDCEQWNADYRTHAARRVVMGAVARDEIMAATNENHCDEIDLQTR